MRVPKIAFILIILFSLNEVIFITESLDKDYRGFILGTSEYVSNEESSIYIHISEFNWENSEVTVSLDINILCRNKSDNNNIHYLLQVPYNITDINIQYHAKEPLFYGGNIEHKYFSEENISYLLITVPKINASLGKLVYIRISFKLKDVVTKLSEYKHKLIFTFDNDFNDALYEVENIQPFGRVIDRCFYFELKSGIINIEKSDIYDVANIEPIPDVVAYWDSTSWYRWNLAEYSSPRFQSTSIIIEYTNEKIRIKTEENERLTWFFYGAFFSFGLSFVSRILWAKFQKPRLNINAIVIDENEPKIHPRIPLAFYHLEILNSGRSSAISCDISLIFQNENMEELFRLTGKWDRSPEPLGPLQPEGGTQLWPSLSAIGNLINIRPGLPETFCIVIKGNEVNSYAFNSDSYFYGFKNPHWVLTQGTYYVDVEIRGGNASVKSKFEITNIGNTNRDIRIRKM